MSTAITGVILGNVVALVIAFRRHAHRLTKMTIVAGTVVTVLVLAASSPAHGMKPVTVPYDGSRPDLEEVIAATWPIEQLDHAISTAWCESRGKATASNGSFRGLFQMGRREWAKYGRGSIYDPYDNSAAAYRYWADVERTSPGKGWLRWECR